MSTSGTTCATTSDPSNIICSWDARNCALRVTYPESGNQSDFAYGPTGECVKIVETVASSIVSTKQFIWCGAQRCEERDGSGSLSNGKQFFPLGQVNFASGTPTNYFYTQDHLGSTREMTKTIGGTTTIEAQYAYDPFGIATKLQGSQDADFQYAGYYMHAPSGLNLPVFRAYSSSLGRFINRDPIGEAGGVNLYAYVGGNPVSFTDPFGFAPPGMGPPVPTFRPGSQNNPNEDNDKRPGEDFDDRNRTKKCPGKVVSPRGPGASEGPMPPGYKMVSRWISREEADEWIRNRGTTIPGGIGAGNRVYVTDIGAPKPEAPVQYE